MNIRRATVNDVDFIKMVFSTPGIWDAVSDDNTPSIDKLDMSVVVNTTYMLIPDNIGCFTYHPWNSVTWEMHSAVLPEYRGKQALEGASLAGHWMFDNTPCRKIVTLIPANNVRARALAHAGGMVKEGIVTQSYLKGGKLIDMHIYGITKEVAKCLYLPE